MLLQCILEHFGKPVHITGDRTAAHNAAVAAASRASMFGKAADFWVDDVLPRA